MAGPGRGGRQLSTLYVCATPIGNLEDVSPRLARVLGEVTAIAAEDTRITARLLARVAIRKPMISYRAPVEARTLRRVLDALEAGDVALVSDAGTPTVNDPGQRLVEAAWEAGHTVSPIPGPSAVVAALSVAGFAGGGFTFAGYLPRKPGEMRRLVEALPGHPTVAFDSPYRVRKSLALVAEVAPELRLTVARELSKLHEQVVRGTASECLDQISESPKGEFTIVFASAR